MAKLERSLTGDFDSFLAHIDQGVLSGSISASFEDGSDWQEEGVRVAVRVYERYSVLGENRVSLNVTIIGKGRDLLLSAIPSGGSQAMFFKINRFGEQSFLDKLSNLVDDYRG